MRRLSCQLGVLLGLLILPVLLGCRAMPLQIAKADGEVDLQRYTTLVVKDFQNGVGDALPPGLLQELPEAVTAHLNACYPEGFSRIERTATGSSEELVVVGTITEERDDGEEESKPGDAKLLSKVTVEDGESGRVLMQIGGELPKKLAARPLGEYLLTSGPFLVIQAITSIPAPLLAPPFWYRKIDVDTVGRQIADAIAENRGVPKTCVSQTDKRL